MGSKSSRGHIAPFKITVSRKNHSVRKNTRNQDRIVASPRSIAGHSGEDSPNPAKNGFSTGARSSQKHSTSGWKVSTKTPILRPIGVKLKSSTPSPTMKSAQRKTLSVVISKKATTICCRSAAVHVNAKVNASVVSIRNGLDRRLRMGIRPLPIRRSALPTGKRKSLTKGGPNSVISRSISVITSLSTLFQETAAPANTKNKTYHLKLLTNCVETIAARLANTVNGKISNAIRLLAIALTTSEIFLTSNGAFLCVSFNATRENRICTTRMYTRTPTPPAICTPIVIICAFEGDKRRCILYI